MARISLQDLMDLSHRVGEGYRAGIDMRSIWNREANFGSLRNQTVAKQVADDIDRGVTLGEAMSNRGEYFPELAIAVATAGEQGGRLERAFFLLRDHYKKLISFRTQVLLSIGWPLFELVATVFVIGAMMWIMDFVVSISGGQPIDWLGFGWSTLQYFVLYMFVVIMFFGSIAVAVIGTIRGWFGTVPMQIARRIPLVGKIIENLAYSRFAWALSAVVESGINVKEGIRLALRATGNHYFQELESDVFDRLEKGQELTESLAATQRFSREFLMYTENAEMTGEIPETMQKLAEDYLERVNRDFSSLAKVLFFVCFAIVGLIICIAIIFLFKAVILDPREEIMRDLGL